jgi:hypothetical protein
MSTSTRNLSIENLTFLNRVAARAQAPDADHKRMMGNFTRLLEASKAALKDDSLLAAQSLTPAKVRMAEYKEDIAKYEAALSIIKDAMGPA